MRDSSRTFSMPAAKKPKKKAVRRISPSTPAARDKGPRLLPLDEKKEEFSPGKTSEYYAKLAEKVLRSRQSKN